MYKLLKLSLIILFSGLIKVDAQTPQTAPPAHKFGKITPQEFETKGFGQDSAAAAVKIFDIGEGSFDISTSTGGFVYVFSRHVRYKIINKNGYDLADLEIQLYHGNKGSEEKLSAIHAATYNLNDNKIEVSKMATDAKFTSQLDKNIIIKKFTLPNVKEGSIIEYEYTTTSDFTFKLDDWYFQSSYPCKYSSYTIKIPEYFQYKRALGGYIYVHQNPSVPVTQNYYFTGTNNSKPETVTSTSTETQYFAENIPAIKSENYITTLQDYISKIGFELTSTSFPGSSYKDYSSSWPKIVNEMMNEEKFGQFIKHDNYSKGLSSTIVKTEKDPELQTNLIFDYIKNNIKWNGKYSYYTTETNQRTVLDKKSGNSADINLSLFLLLKAAGINCYPVLLSTRANGAHPGYPLETKFNNVIVQVEIGDKKLLLDATDKNHVCDLISYQNLNHQGLRIDLNMMDAEWIPIENINLSRTNVMYMLTLKTDNTLTGSLAISSDNYDGLQRRTAYQSAASEAEFLKTYKSNKTGLEISNYKISNLDHPDLPLMETMDITIEDNVEDAGNLAYLMPMLFERTKENPFSLEERNFPVDFAHPFEENFRLTIDFPATYQLDKLPKNEKFVLPKDAGSFSIIYVVEGNKIAIRSKINILKPIFSADEYYTLKELYKNIIRKQAEQIVFKKS
ncbi:DUF3857 domain-containing protein [Pedobacter sp. L105]|uniref:DUF3857 domain-containing protein n=1 Tax=Pedobacter sp. L105 TaxID=1641871 RepID=UPI00131AAFBF|nr:DUF3857 domain-containing protein [Pedobacter sp. L105]